MFSVCTLGMSFFIWPTLCCTLSVHIRRSYQSHLGPRKHIKKGCKYCLSGNLKWFTNHLMSIAEPCCIDIFNGLQIISNIYQWTL
ncbi:hypothetical protein E4T56_gene20063 [Termitomyces sp. T112]|nr:hypothetical protein E4T56_gene20063 [Termitomyces sp. T112]